MCVEICGFVWILYIYRPLRWTSCRLLHHIINSYEPQDSCQSFVSVAILQTRSREDVNLAHWGVYHKAIALFRDVENEIFQYIVGPQSSSNSSESLMRTLSHRNAAIQLSLWGSICSWMPHRIIGYICVWELKCVTKAPSHACWLLPRSSLSSDVRMLSTPSLR